jgi:AraC-like DNA-binding protein
MSRSRQQTEPAVRGYSVTHPPGRVALPTEAGWDQLLYTASGTMTITTPGSTWTVPPHRALSIPDGECPTVENRFPVAVRTLYFDAALKVLPEAIRAVEIGGFSRQLLLYVVGCCPLDLGHDVHAALVTVLVDQLRHLPEAPLRLVWPHEHRAVAAAHLIVEDATRDLTDIARTVGTGRRSLERTFRAETSLTLGAWHRRARILRSLDHLATGSSVTEAAFAAGYSAASAYVAAFHHELGQTPRQFLRH